MNHRAKNFLEKMNDGSVRGLTEDLAKILETNSIELVLARMVAILKQRGKLDESKTIEKMIRDIGSKTRGDVSCQDAKN